MSDITPIETLSTLASLKISGYYHAKMSEDIRAILAYVAQIQKVEVGNSFALGRLVGEESMRVDVVAACSQKTREGIVAQFPRRSKDGLLEAYATVVRDL